MANFYWARIPGNIYLVLLRLTEPNRNRGFRLKPNRAETSVLTMQMLTVTFRWE